MVKHIVFFKLKDNSDENKNIVKNKLLTLKEHVKELKHIEVGINFAEEERAYDIALLTDFESIEDLQSYAVDVYHKEIIVFMKSVTFSSKVVDFKY